MEQTLWADNDAEMWQGAYYQTARAERENAQLLYQNRQLKEEVEQALAAAARAGESPLVFLECDATGSIVEGFVSLHQILQVQPSSDQCCFGISSWQQLATQESTGVCLPICSV